MFQYMLPIFHRELWVSCADYCNEVILEGSDEPLCCVASVHTWRGQLVVY